MKVKLRDPKRVYFDRETGIVFHGKKIIETKVTQGVRELLNEGALIEVVESKPKVQPQLNSEKA